MYRPTPKKEKQTGYYNYYIIRPPCPCHGPWSQHTSPLFQNTLSHCNELHWSLNDDDQEINLIITTY